MLADFLFECRDLTVRFGGITAVRSLDLLLRPGEVVGLIGPNGAGKTTVFNAVTGVCRPQSGAITFAGRSILGRRPDQISAAGIARTFQNIRLFKSFTVLGNVLLACHRHMGYGLLPALLRTPGFCRAEREVAKQGHRLLDLLELGGQAATRADSLSHGEQRRLEIARALATEPRLLLLDEPAAGMNAAEKLHLAALLGRVRGQFGLTLLVIEHDMPFVMGMCARLLVLDRGEVIAAGTPEEIRRDPKVIQAYLGDPDDA